MGRHSLPDDSGRYGAGVRAIAPPFGKQTGGRRRSVVAATLVLVVGAGAAAAAGGGLLPFGEPCGGDDVRVRVAASPSIAPAVRKVADRARAEHVTSDSRCLDIRVTEHSEDGFSEPRGEGGEDDGARVAFDVWLPDSSLRVDRAAAEGGGTLEFDTIGTIAVSPVVLAAVPSAAEKLGWPEKTYTWAELAATAMAEEPLRIGTADPARSATGLLALARIQQSAARQGGKGTAVRTAATAKLLAERTSPGDAQVLATLPQPGSGAEQSNPQLNQALILSEQAAHAHNRADGGGPDLRLFYPEEGTAVLDYPFTLVAPDRMSIETARAATRLQALLSSSEGADTLAGYGFRPGSGTGTAPELIRRAGGRAPQPFGATEDDLPTARELGAVRGMWEIIVRSDRLTVVVDSSGSMSAPVPGRPGESRMDVTRSSLLQGLSQFTSDDEIGLWEFSTLLEGRRDHRELVPAARLGSHTGERSTQREKLTAAFGDLKPIPGGATGLYDSTLAAYEDARKTYSEGKFNALVILTDGSNQDPDSISRRELIDELGELHDPEAPIPLIMLAIGPDADVESCRAIARAASGSAHPVSDPAQIHVVILKAIMAAAAADDPVAAAERRGLPAVPSTR